MLLIKEALFLLANASLEQMLKHSVAYGYVMTQPFSFYVDAYPMLQNELFKQDEVIIAYGDHSNMVRVLQQKLNDLTYYDEEIDGEFGIFTEYALKKFQSDHDITANGAVDVETVQRLLEQERQRYLAPLRKIDQPLEYGEIGDHVKTIQEALYYFGYYLEEVDSIFGPKTNKALTDFQQDHGLTVTNSVNDQLIQTMAVESEVRVSSAPKEVSEQEETVKAANKSDYQTFDVNQLLQGAKDHIGTRYSWGGTSPDGFDCSGYIQYVFKQKNIQLPRTVSEMWNVATRVDQPSVGDLVFFETYKKGPSHAGIYMGNNQFIHASESRGVQVSELSETYWQERYLGARRIQVNK